MNIRSPFVLHFAEGMGGITIAIVRIWFCGESGGRRRRALVMNYTETRQSME